MAADQEIDRELLAERNSYLREVKSDLQDVENLILDLSLAEGASERKQRLARQIHTIKGVAGSYGLDLLSAAAHRMEDLLASENSPRLENNEFVDSLLAHNDQLAAIAKAYLVGDEPFLSEMRREYRKKPQAGQAKLVKGFNRVMIVEPSRATLQLCIRVYSKSLARPMSHQWRTVTKRWDGCSRKSSMRLSLPSRCRRSTDNRCLQWCARFPARTWRNR
jgi:HPt (histidine-containing phosphotransfer) domain-containing protein